MGANVDSLEESSKRRRSLSVEEKSGNEPAVATSDTVIPGNLRAAENDNFLGIEQARENNAVAPEPNLQRRKRQFTNRTKTGCITCRRRKKKCDEGKPECSNCKRGGFNCEGYTNKVDWTAKAKPMVRAGDFLQSSVNSECASFIAGNPSIKLTTTDVPSRSEVKVKETFFTGSSAAKGEHDQVVLPSIDVITDSEKEKMLSQQLYYPFSPDLMAERELCKAACWRYNNAATNPNLGISKVEQGRLLLEVLRPGRNWESAPNVAGGYMADGYSSDLVDVNIEAPFTCSYGYNIRIGKDVHIHSGCTIQDSNLVTIKNGVVLSPNVSIFCAIYPMDPRRRKDAKGNEIAKPVVIKEDCWLGGNVIVLGGVTIGQGAVIGAGSVVTIDIPPFTLAAGNPAGIIRGLYTNGIEL